MTEKISIKNIKDISYENIFNQKKINENIFDNYLFLNEFTDNFEKDDLILIGGRLGTGKSILDKNIVCNYLANDKSILMLSLEQDFEKQIKMILSMLSDIKYKKIINNRITETDNAVLKEYLKLLKKKKLHILDGIAYKNVFVIFEKIEKYIFENNIDLIIIDYLQMLRRYDEPGLIQKFKDIAIKNKCQMILLSQLSRKVEKRHYKIPELNDLINRNLIEPFCDKIYLINNDETMLLDKRQEHIKTINLICHKNRDSFLNDKTFYLEKTKLNICKAINY